MVRFTVPVAAPRLLDVSPSLPSAETDKVPATTAVGPVYVLAPDRTVVLPNCWVRPLEPLTAAEMVRTGSVPNGELLEPVLVPLMTLGPAPPRASLPAMVKGLLLVPLIEM